VFDVLSSIYSKYGLRIDAVWFCQDARGAVEASRADLVFLHGVDTDPLEHSISRLQSTLVSDLRLDPDVLFGLVAHGYRRQIDKAEKEGIACSFYTSEDMVREPSLLNAFRLEFKEFALRKGVDIAFNAAAVDSYIGSRGLHLTKAVLGGIDLAQHIYVADGRSARCIYSVSNFRTETPGLDHNLIGRANKLLHWQDIRHFQDGRYETYDWGGIRSVTEPTGVDAFKLGFGGEVKSYYNIVAGRSVPGRAAVFFRGLREKTFFT
jgi:hypothetical protein